jgi:hypothetical protein
MEISLNMVVYRARIRLHQGRYVKARWLPLNSVVLPPRCRLTSTYFEQCSLIRMDCRHSRFILYSLLITVHRDLA